MKNLLIIGARGWGREVSLLAQHSLGYGTEFQIKGFLDDKTDALAGLIGYPPIIGSVEHYEPKEDDVFICALGDVRYKKHYAEIILNKGGEFINLIHEKAFVSRGVDMGFGCILGASVSLSCELFIGNFVTFGEGAIVGHDSRIGDYCHLSARCFLGGGVVLGEGVTMHPGSMVLPHKEVGNYATIGALSVVTKKVREGVTVYGNPALMLKY